MNQDTLEKYRLIGKTAVYFSPVFGRIQPVEIVDFLMEKMFLPDDRTDANRNAVMTWLTDHTETDGTITEITDSCYGRLLWEVTNQ